MTIDRGAAATYVPAEAAPIGAAWVLPGRARIGIGCLIVAEAAMFTIFVVAYLFYAGKSVNGPQPADVLHAPVVPTLALIASSLTLHVAAAALRAGRRHATSAWLGLTIVLGAAFMSSTVREWRRLMVVDGLYLDTNLFGTTFYSLTGLHGAHVTFGLLALSLVWGLALSGRLTSRDAERLDALSLYWHFVDVVWVVVFLVVYVIAL